MKNAIGGLLIAASVVVGHASFAQTGGTGAASGVGTAAGGNAAAASAPGIGSAPPPSSQPTSASGANPAPSANPNQVPSTVGVAPNSTAPSTYAPANGVGGSRGAGARTDGQASREGQVVEENEQEVSRRIKNICKGC